MCFHKWRRWEFVQIIKCFEDSVIRPTTAYALQSKTCEKCGLIKYSKQKIV